jgi:Domain of unknown function (DUF4276)
MRYLSSALYCEGAADAGFLLPLLRRLCEYLASDADDMVEVAEVIALADAHEDRRLDRDERIERAARAADGAWVVLFIHADADARDQRAAVSQRVRPAIERLAPLLAGKRQAVAVVPVRMTEAWALADPDALRTVVGATMDDDALGLTAALAHGIERANDPKALLEGALLAARPRARPAQLAAYRGRIGETASLARLQRLAAFRHLEADLRAALLALGILR